MRLKAFLTLIGSIAAAVVSSSARASDDMKEQAKTRKIAFDYASCVVREHHAQSSEAILATASNDAIMAQFGQIIDSDCLENAAGAGVSMNFPSDTYKYALADALVNADFTSHGDGSFADRLPLAQPPEITQEKQAELLAKVKGNRKRKEAQARMSEQNTLAWLSRYGECVVRQDPVNTRYWLLTPPDIPEEASRIKALQPVFDACLRDGTLKLNRAMMRGTVAINYYRIAMATVVPGIGSSH